MKTKNIILIALWVLLTGLVSCKKDHDIPTGKVFVDYEKLLVGTWGVEKIEYYNLDYAGNPILSSLATFNYDPSSTENGIRIIFREDKTGEIRDRAIDTLWVEESSYIVGPDTILVKEFTYYYDKSDSLLYMSMTNSLAPHRMDIKELTNNTFVYEIEYSTKYMEKDYLKRLSDEPLPPLESYIVNVSTNPSSGGVASGGGTYLHGQNCTVTATANIGYSFTNWTENGSVVSTNASYQFTVTDNCSLVANFQAQPEFCISVSANPTNGGNVTGGGTYQQGQSCTVHATANNGYTFINWTEEGNHVSTSASYTFSVSSDRNLVANFVLSTQSIQFEWNSIVYSDGELIECTNDEYGFGELVQHMRIRNNTAESKQIVVEKEIIQNLEGTMNYFCWGLCFGSDTYVSPDPVLIPANTLTDEGVLSFHALFDENVFGDVVVRYYAYEEQSSGERISIIVRFRK